MRPILILLAAAAFLIPPSHGWAQETPSVVIAPPFVKGALPDAISASIANELEQAFTRYGWRVVGLSDALQLAVPNPGPCNNNTCALAYADAAHVDAALQLSLFSHANVTFSLALVQPPGDAFVHHGTMVDPYHPAPFLTTATDDLLAQHTNGPGPWLVVKGAPLDAAVRLDGEVIGVLPLRRRISGGEHVLVVSAEGHADHNDTIWVDNAAGAAKEVMVDLQPAPHTVPAVADDHRVRDLVIGSSVLVLGGAGMAWGIVQGTKQRCLDRTRGTCLEQSTPWRPGAIAITATGAAAILFGAAWLAWRVVLPRDYTISPDLSPTQAGIHFSREF